MWDCAFEFEVGKESVVGGILFVAVSLLLQFFLSLTSSTSLVML